MSARKLGGGRILGSGKGLAPPTPPTAPPSDSTVSLGSASPSPPVSGSLPDLGQDIGASISVGAQAKSNAANKTALFCPICNEEMVTLLQLNRHIDDSHQELPEAAQNEVKTWFDKQVLKAKRFQPLSLINQKLRGLEVFESNESLPIPTSATATAAAAATAAGKSPAEAPIDPDDVITRSHWQRSTHFDACTDPACGKRLGPMNGSVNCRHCGKLFCEEHTMYQMKLSRTASHEPVRGYWARVCETCYKSRDGYNDHNGVSVDHMDFFSGIRRTKVERQKLDVSRLEKRLTKLTKLLSRPPDKLPSHNGSILSPVSTLTGQLTTRKLLEQSVVTWQDDDKVTQCPLCQQEFGSWTFRRHHCRICGRVVCADTATGCSSQVSLNITTPANLSPEKTPPAGPADVLALAIRMCRECNHTIFSGRDFTASVLHKPPDQRAYDTLRQFERGICQLLPAFHRALQLLQPAALPSGETDLTKPPPTHAQIQEAGKIRKRLMDSFGKYGVAAKRLRDLETGSPTQQRLQQAVYAYSSSFLHANMLPLKSLPQLLRRRSAASHPSRFLTIPAQSTSSLRHSELASDAGSQAASEASTVVSQLETEEKDLRERLAVLEEQKFLVDEMMRSATSARRFEEAGALSANAFELDKEAQELKTKIDSVEQKWEHAHRSGLA
ncbi:hypothetical protein UVI_02049490 [Ustilaginoidea virens]|uniref:FYVE-type domain-containing protein n=1 Tax=Ustilaginoidea virens TaxID=1159556 RepID=A0A1B5KZ63_USTVR|nr:hypothetical protein UVI_02049490 [Ustilaginoidea virens]